MRGELLNQLLKTVPKKASISGFNERIISSTVLQLTAQICMQRLMYSSKLVQIKDGWEDGRPGTVELEGGRRVKCQVGTFLYSCALLHRSIIKLVMHEQVIVGADGVGSTVHKQLFPGRKCVADGRLAEWLL